MISVVVFCDPQHDNSGEQLVRCYAEQTLPYDQFEVVIADNCERRELAAAVASVRERVPGLNIRYESTNVIGRAATINRGARAARFPLLAIMADDALPTRTALESFVSFHQQNPHPLAVAIGPTLFSRELRQDGLRRWLEDSGTLFGVPMRNAFSIWPKQFFFTGNVCFKLGLMRQIGEFNETFPWITWDDYEFGTRLVAAGGYSHLVTGALAWHEHYVTLEERTGAMRKGGHAAALHEKMRPTTMPWLPSLEAAHRERNTELPADDPALSLPLRVARIRKIFDRAFLEGYEAERRGDRSDLEGLLATT